jgi:hypothetical protein
MKRKQVALFLAVLALILWVYFNNRQDEMYNPEKDELIGYVTSDDFDPDVFKQKLSKMTKDDDAILIAYTLAKQRDYDGLFEFVDNYFPE